MLYPLAGNTLTTSASDRCREFDAEGFLRYLESTEADATQKQGNNPLIWAERIKERNYKKILPDLWLPVK